MCRPPSQGLARGPKSAPPGPLLNGDRGARKDAAYDVCSGLRAQLRLERRLLRFKDGNGFWWVKLSSVILWEVVGMSSGSAAGLELGGVV
jgi:hypothetical protein